MNASFFLIRTKQNQILGPVVKEDLVKRVLHGELESLDEICPASGYWVFLHEREEVKNILGVEPPTKRKKRDSDDTDTETETETATATVTGTDKMPLPKSIAPSQGSDHFGVERPSILKFMLYGFLGALVFILIKLFELTRS